MGFERKAMLRLAQAVEWAHFFAEPVFVPIVEREEFGSLTFDPAGQKGEGQSGRNTPDAEKIMNSVCHNIWADLRGLEFVCL